MENASKALLMAGGVMLTMLVVSLLLYAWTSVSEYQQSQVKLMEFHELAEFNQQFTNYQREDVQGYELLSLVNKVIDYNQRFSEEGTSTSSAGNYAQFEPITIFIKLDSETNDYTNRDKFTGTITIPATAKSTGKLMFYDEIIGTIHEDEEEKKYDKNLSRYNNNYRLFKKHEYKQSNTINEFGSVLNTINNIETYFGGSTNAQNLTKSRGTIYESKIIYYNGKPKESEQKNWHQESYIKNRYKTLTRKDENVDEIRDPENVKKILQYYEYMEFKKAEFECIGINYADGETGESNTGRIIGMSFKIKE